VAASRSNHHPVVRPDLLGVADLTTEAVGSVNEVVGGLKGMRTEVYYRGSYYLGSDPTKGGASFTENPVAGSARKACGNSRASTAHASAATVRGHNRLQRDPQDRCRVHPAAGDERIKPPRQLRADADIQSHTIAAPLLLALAVRGLAAPVAFFARLCLVRSCCCIRCCERVKGFVERHTGCGLLEKLAVPRITLIQCHDDCLLRKTTEFHSLR